MTFDKYLVKTDTEIAALAALLKDTFYYDPQLGGLYNKYDRQYNALKDQRVGSIRRVKNVKEYRYVKFKRELYPEHHLVWLYHKGKFPEQKIDHINGNGLDNRIDNLRDVSQSENCRNMKRSKLNKSGFTGVSWDKEANKWTSYIQHNRKKIKLGRFKEMNNAILARKIAEKVFDYHPNHGRNAA